MQTEPHFCSLCWNERRIQIIHISRVQEICTYLYAKKNWTITLNAGVDRIHQTEIYDRWTGLGPTALWQRPVYGPYQCQLYPYWTYGVLLIPLVTCEGAHFLRTVSQQMGKCVRCSGIFRQYVIQGRRKIHFYMDSLTVYFKIVWKYYLYKNFKI